jgi:hypothetical protein
MLCNNHTGFDGLAEANFVGKDHALGERRLKCKKGGIDLMRLGFHTGRGQAFGKSVVVSAFQSKPMRQIRAVM